jgi:hypothetical protein
MVNFELIAGAINSKLSGQCGKHRQSRMLSTWGTALRDAPRDPEGGSTDPRSGTSTARNNMQRSRSRDEDPAWPVILALIRPRGEIAPGDFSA